MSKMRVSFLRIRESVAAGSRYIVWAVTLLHFLWAVLLWIYGSVVYGATPLHIWNSVPPRLLAVLFFVIGLLGILSVEFFIPINKPVATILLLPQQVILAISVYAITHAISMGRYGDGEFRPKVFILADQAPLLLVFLIHFMFVLNLALLSYRINKVEDEK